MAKILKISSRIDNFAMHLKIIIKNKKKLGYLFTSGLSSSISWVAACFAGLRISARLITLKISNIHRKCLPSRQLHVQS